MHRSRRPFLAAWRARLVRAGESQLVGPLRRPGVRGYHLPVYGLTTAIDRVSIHAAPLPTLRRRVRRRKFSRSKSVVRPRVPVDSFAADADSVRGAGTEMRPVA